MKKDEILQEIFKSEAYSAALSRITSKERKMIEEILHGKFSEVISMMQGFAEKVHADPAARYTFEQATKVKAGIINDEGPVQPEDDTKE